uniref:C2H2-type domain-containing protein n=1 Tax=viral metagenome TaxID=1070528 RepID=A0A6C0I465_9ZZZZ
MDFHCSICNIACAHKCDYDRHINTAKHKNKIAGQGQGQSIVPNSIIYGCDVCGKTYKFRSGLSIHKRTHALQTQTQTQPQPQDKQFSDLIEVVKDLMAHNKEVVSQNKDMINQNKVLVDAIQTKMANDSTLALTLASSGGNKITNNTNNITNNTQFNLNVFLNEDCKDAINLSDFVKTLKITLQDLEFTKTNGIVEGVSSIIVNNLKGMDVHKRPIHCTDLKRETMYVKNDEWIKDDMHEHINKFIYLTSCYQTRVIQDWMNAHPGWETKERMHTEYHNICKELYKKIENDERANKKIIKAFLKEVHLAKNGSELV